MNRQRAVVVLCAVCCCFALVTLSSSLDATVSGSPEDEFDVGGVYATRTVATGTPSFAGFTATAVALLPLVVALRP